MSELLLVVTIGGRRAAVRASEVQSVIELEAMTPVPRAPAYVMGMAALRSRALTVINCARSLALPETGPNQDAARPVTVVVEHDGHLYGLLVDAVDDVVESHDGLSELRANPGHGWKQASLGVTESPLGPLIVLDPVMLVGGPPVEQSV